MMASSQWAVCGDAAGRVHLLRLGLHKATVWDSWDTPASLREKQRTVVPPKRATSSIAYPNAVLAVAWSPSSGGTTGGGGGRIAALTSRELVCWDGNSESLENNGVVGSFLFHTRLANSHSLSSSSKLGENGGWGPIGGGGGRNVVVIPVDDGTTTTASANSSSANNNSSTNIPSSNLLSSSQASMAAHANSRIQLEFHPRGSHKLLWVPGNGPHPVTSSSATVAQARNSLYILERGRRTCRPAMLHCLSAAWDMAMPSSSSSSEAGRDNWSDDCVLAVVRRDGDSLALVRYDLIYNRIWTDVSLSGIVPSVVRTANIQVHPGASSSSSSVVTLCTSRGVYVHDLQTLMCLAVVGDTVALHGRHVTWDSCAVLPEPCVNDGRSPPNEGSATGFFGHGSTAAAAGSMPLSGGSERGGGGNVNGTVNATSSSSSSKGGSAGTKQPRAWIQLLDGASADDAPLPLTGPMAPNDTDPEESESGAVPAAPPPPHNHRHPPPSHLRLVAIPQPFKQPIELQSAMHVWKLEVPTAHPLTLPLPPGGVTGWTIALDAQGGWTIAGLCAEFGTAWEWRAALHSDFAGREYPVGYKVVQDNVEYIEDEDELDQVVESEDDSAVAPHSPSRTASLLYSPTPSTASREELEQALQRSAEDALVQVLPNNPDDDPVERAAASCPPRVTFAPPAPPEEDAPNDASPVGAPTPDAELPQPPSFLACLPHYGLAMEAASALERATSSAENPVVCPPAPPPPVVAATTDSAATSTDAATSTSVAAAAATVKRGKRTRTANVEAALQASVVPALRQRMAAGMKVWGDGRGSACPETTGTVGLFPTSAPSPNHQRPCGRRFHPPSDCGAEDSASLPDKEVETMSEASEGVARPQSSNGGSVAASKHESEITEAAFMTSAAAELSNTEKVDIPSSPSAPAQGLAGADQVAAHGVDVERQSAMFRLTSNGTRLDKERLALQMQLNARERDRVSPSISSKVSAEEKELALELLMLSPGPLKASRIPASSHHPNPADNGVEGSHSIRRSFIFDTDPSNSDGDAVVTPSEQSPTLLSGALAAPSTSVSTGLEQIAQLSAEGVTTLGEDPMTQPMETNDTPTTSDVVLSVESTASFCPACHGRMVFHRCGKRDKPIDYDAIERAEKEQKEREEAEKLQRRVEKRRAAEARRREARRQKKEEEERKRVEEEEKLRQLEADGFQRAHIQERTEEVVTEVRTEAVKNVTFGWNQDSTHPSFSPLNSHTNGSSPAPSKAAVSHAFRVSDSVEGNEAPFYQRPTPPSYHASSQAWNGNAQSESHLAAPPKEQDLRADVPNHTSFISDKASYDHDRLHAPSAYYGQTSMETDTTRHQQPVHPIGHDGSVNRTYASDSGASEGGPLNHSNSQHLQNSSGEGHAESGNHVSRTGYYSGSSAFPRTVSSSFRSHLTDLKPSTTLSAADALEALAGLADSLSAVPNVPVRQSDVHERGASYTDSSPWSSHQYSSYSEGSQPAIRPEHSSQQFYQPYSQVQAMPASHGVMSDAYSTHSWTGSSNATTHSSNFQVANPPAPEGVDHRSTGIMPHCESVVESIAATAPSDAAAGPVNVPANNQL